MRELRNPSRVRRLIEEAIRFNALDLRGLIVYTETGSGNCVTTPVIAAVAGAHHVTAIVQDSPYGRADRVADYTRRFAAGCGVSDRVEVVFDKTPETIGAADIVTNLGFVRPIDRQFVSMMKPGAVVPLMYEAWELRSTDVDVAACRERGIAVVGTNEDLPGLELFKYAGPICMQMLFEVEVEVYRSTLGVYSRDKFGGAITTFLQRAGAEVVLFDDLQCAAAKDFLRRADALILANYAGAECVVGPGAQISGPELKRIAPGLTIILFAGLADVAGLRAAGLPVHPDVAATRPRKMYRLFADLGPRPHIELMTASLKVGEVMARGETRPDLAQQTLAL